MLDPLSFFSLDELTVWAAQGQTNDLLRLTGLSLKIGFMVVFVMAGLHLWLNDRCRELAHWIYARPTLGLLGQRLKVMGRVFKAFEKLGDKSGQQPTRWLQDMLYPVGFLLVWAPMMLPFSFFTSFVLSHERGLSNTSLGLWWFDWGRSLLSGSLLYGLLGLGLFGLARRLPRSWWLWLWGATVGMLVVWSMLSPYRAQIYNDFTPLPQGDTRQAIEALMEDSGYELEHIKVIDTSRRSKHASAFVMGDGPTRQVVLGDNLVAGFNPREIRVALAHELGHEKRDHQGRTWLTLAGAAFVFLLLVRLVLWGGPRIRRLGLRPDADPATLPLIMILLLFLFLANQPLSAYLDRAEEYEADREALTMTEDPTAFCSLMVRLARTNQADVDPPALRHWFWAHHPSVKQRLSFALTWAQENGQTIKAGAIPLPAPPAAPETATLSKPEPIKEPEH